MPEKIAEVGIVGFIKALRTDCDMFEKTALAFKDHIANPATVLPENANRGEMIANAMLAYRHLEDARMRFGKIIQAHDGGASIYDAAPAPEQK